MKKTSICLLVVILLGCFSMTVSAYENPLPFYDGNGNQAPMGDPFVMKYNGTYYCYVSGGNCWRSTNMVDWQFLGCVFQGEHSENLYAPEVFHWNGAFYSISCPNGTTNYIFKSEKPEGPFVVISDAIGGGIDGSLFRDDDGSIWFTHAAWNGISLYKMETPETVPTFVSTLPQSISGMWTEGPSIFKRDGLYYMTYTGNHVLDYAYRVEYAVSENISEGWYEPDQNLLLLSTTGETLSLGHNSVVIGPDLDSYYIVYHNRYPDGTSAIDRGFNMQRILWNDTKLTVAISTNKQEDPELPQYVLRPAEGIEALHGKRLSEEGTETSFTAEFNLIPKNTDILFAYLNDENYCRLSFSDGVMQYERVINGTSQVQNCPLAQNTELDVLQCVRVSQTADRLTVFLEGGLLLDSKPVGCGKIGYESENGTIGYTAFSNKAMGNMDHTAQKIVGAVYDAVFANNRDELTIVDSQKTGHALRLFSNERVRFDISSQFNTRVTVGIRGCASQQAVMNLYVNGSLVKENVVFSVSNTYRTEILREIRFPKGDVCVEIEVVSGEFDFYELETIEETSVKELNLTMDRSGAGLNLQEGDAKYVGGKLVLTSTTIPEGKAEDFAKAVMGSVGWGDYSVEVKLTLNGTSPDSQAGIFLRTRNVSDTEASAFRFKRPWYKQCYYVCIKNNAICLYKQDFGETLLCQNKLAADLALENTLKVSAVGDTITVWFNGEELLRYTDIDHPFTNGKMGLQVEKGSATYDDLTIMPITLDIDDAPTPPITDEPHVSEPLPPKKGSKFSIVWIGGAFLLVGCILMGTFLIRKRK